jgi:hypothetical protein
MPYYDSHGWYTATPITGRAAPSEPANTSETTVPGQLRANWSGYEWLDLPYQAPAAPPEPAVPVPDSVTMRQARRALHAAGLLAGVEAAIDALTEPDKTAARIEWEYSSEVQRHNGFVAQLAPALSLSEAQLDALFVAAAAL